MNQKYITLSEQLRKIIADSGQSQYAIWKAAGIDKGSLSRFMAGKTGLTLSIADKLGEYFGLRITADKIRKDK